MLVELFVSIEVQVASFEPDPKYRSKSCKLSRGSMIDDPTHVGSDIIQKNRMSFFFIKKRVH